MSEKQINAIFNRRIKKHHKVLGRGVTTNIQLDDYCKQLFPTKFNGTYSADNFKITKKKPYAIINNKTSFQLGEHWMTCILHNNQYIVWDSFGREIHKISPHLFKKIGGHMITPDPDPDQHMIEEDCGSRVIASLEIYDKYGIDALMKL